MAAPRATRALFLAGILLAAPACGARTSLSLGGSQGAGGASGLPPADGGVPDAASCGAPWVLFTLLESTDGGAPSQRVYARRADGTDGHVVALPHPQAIYPSVVPGGASLLYASAAVDQLFLYRFADGTSQTLPTTGRVGYGSLSPDGQAVVYGDGTSLHLVGVGVPGSDHVLLPSPDAPGGAAGYPVFRQDSQTIVYAAVNVVQSIQVDGSGAQTLLTERTDGTFPNPAFSPDHGQLATVISCDGRSYALRIYPFGSLPAGCDAGREVIAVDGSAPYYDLAWGPTDLIAYSGGHDVFLVSAAGGTAISLTADLTGTMSSASQPTWAPSCAVLP